MALFLFLFFVFYISILSFIFQSYVENGRKDLWWTRRHLDGMYLHAVVVYATQIGYGHDLLNIENIGLNAMTLHKRTQECLQIANILFPRNSSKKSRLKI